MDLTEISSNSSFDISALIAGSSVILVVAGIISLFFIICMVKIFKKFGKPGWAAIVPIYNVWVMLDCGGLPGWLSLIPVANGVGVLVSYFTIPKKLGKSGAFGLGLLFLPVIFFPVLAFSSGSVVESDNSNNENLMNSQPANNQFVDNTPSNINQTSVQPDLMSSQSNTDMSETLMSSPAPVANEEVQNVPTEPTVTSEFNEMPALNMGDNSINVSENTTPNMNNTVNPFESSPDVLNVSEAQNNSYNSLVSEQNVQSPNPAPLDNNSNIETLDTLSNVPSTDSDVLQETVELPKMANVEINQNISEKKKCSVCGFDNDYSSKTCSMCGNELN